MKTGFDCRWTVGAVLGLALLTSGCERPPVETVQTGYRGTAMAQVYNPRTLQAQAAHNAVPEIAAPARVRVGGPTAGTTYQNVKVLGDLSIAEFGRTMDAMTQWVAPEAGCLYCHVEGNFADDGKYTKVVARRMVQMVQNVNTNWKPHVADTGVTCYTCHRGKPLPAEVWFRQPPERGHDVMGDRAGQNTPARSVGLSSLPFDPFTPYLLDDVSAKPIRVAGTTALNTGNRSSTKQAEFTYGLMTHFSKSLGVNCTYCHNTRAFANWEESRPQRTTAWYGIRMARDINGNYLEKLSPTFPEIPLGRLGPMKDAAKVHCATCHQGAYKPLYGAAMAKHYPALLRVTALAPAEQPADEPAAVAVPAPAAAVAEAAPTPAVAPAPAPAPAPGAAPVPAPAPQATREAPALAQTPQCAEAAKIAKDRATPVAADASPRRVTGTGRLQFFSAPDAACAVIGLFIVPGDLVQAQSESNGYTAVYYVNPRVGNEAVGWVLSSRLVPAGPR